MTKIKKTDHFYLIDGSGYIFRAYYALPPLTRSDGLPVGAVAGFCNMLYKLLTQNDRQNAPTHIAIIFDHKGETFRSKIYPDYKMNRISPPEDLIPQFELIKEATRSFGLACGYFVPTFYRRITSGVALGPNVELWPNCRDWFFLAEPRRS